MPVVVSVRTRAKMAADSRWRTRRRLRTEESCSNEIGAGVAAIRSRIRSSVGRDSPIGASQYVT